MLRHSLWASLEVVTAREKEMAGVARVTGATAGRKETVEVAVVTEMAAAGLAVVEG